MPTAPTHVSDGIPYAEGWGRILQSERRWRCRVCADHTGAFADISVGDPWHAPPEGDTDAGRSLIVARTPARTRLRGGRNRGGRSGGRARPRDVIASGAAQPQGDPCRRLGPPRRDADGGPARPARCRARPVRQWLGAVAAAEGAVGRRHVEAGHPRATLAPRADRGGREMTLGQAMSSGRTGNLDTLRLAARGERRGQPRLAARAGPRHGGAVGRAHRPFAGRLGGRALLLPLGPFGDGERRAPPRARLLGRARAADRPGPRRGAAGHVGTGTGERRGARA
jgi:hypothetical protein